MTDLPSTRLIRFGVFELDAAAGELRREERKVPLQDQPFRLLLMLAESPGVVRTREEIKSALWPSGTFVDFDYGVNTAVRKIRHALGDHPDTPRFIETLPRKGYRFIAPVAVAECPAFPASHLGPAAASARRYTWWVALAATVLVSAAAAAWWSVSRTRLAPAAAPPAAIPLTSLPGIEMDPSFSPDGRQVAFSWNGERENDFNIYLKTIGSEKTTQLTVGPQQDLSPTWSPDGQFIAFLRYFSRDRSGVFMVRAGGGPEVRLAECRDLNFPWTPRPLLCWSPLGDWIALSDAEDPATAARMGQVRTSIYLLSTHTGQRRRITWPPEQSMGDSGPAFSPDGRSLAFVRNPNVGISELMIQPLTADLDPLGVPRKLKTGFPMSCSPAWTPDGGEILFATGSLLAGREVKQWSPLWRISPLGNEAPKRIEVAGESAFYPAVSRNGRLAYSQAVSDTNIRRVELAGPGIARGSPIRVAASTRHDFNPQFAPDGKRIVFLSDRGGTMEVWTSQADGSSPQQLTSLGATVTGCPRWSPDGSSIVFDSNHGGRFRLYLMSAVGGTPRPLTDEGSDAATASWSHDGRWIYFTSNRSGDFQIWRMPSVGGAAMQLTRGGGRAPFESVDGKQVYYHTTVFDHGTDSIWRVRVDGGDEQQVVPLASPFSLAVTREGLYFLPGEFALGPRSVGFYRFSTGKATTVLESEVHLSKGLAVTPDGRFLLFCPVDSSLADIMLVEKFR